MIISKTVKVRVNHNNVKYYQEKGYLIPQKLSADGKRMISDTSAYIDIAIEDLPLRSDAKILVKCDICGNEHWLRYVDYNKSIASGGYYVCRNCAINKIQETFLRKYGTITPYNIPGVREKAEATLLKNWGTKSSLANPEIRERIKQTCNIKYGGNAPACDEQIKQKQQQTFIERYGNYCSSYVPEIQAKIAKSLAGSNSVHTSSQQLYLHDIWGGILNYPIKQYNVDICLEENKIVIEYNGSGHDLSVKYQTMTQEEFQHREIVRNNVIKRAGYKIIHLISHTDKLPSDPKLLEILELSKQYFNEYPNHSWIEWHLDDGFYCNAEHKDGIPYDFGELRKIKKEEIAS